MKLLLKKLFCPQGRAQRSALRQDWELLLWGLALSLGGYSQAPQFADIAHNLGKLYRYGGFLWGIW